MCKRQCKREVAPSDCVALPRQIDGPPVEMPWVGFGTYKLSDPKNAVLTALRLGYRCIDTAFIYGGEKTEPEVGKAICDAISEGTVTRTDLFVITKQWRKFHGEELTARNLDLSLGRLQLDYIDLYLIHWPGPAWKTMNRENDLIAEHGAWFYAASDLTEETIADARAGTWRAMEAALKAGKVRAIGVSNFTVAHLEHLKTIATVWPPTVNQVELHPMYQQAGLQDYCRKEGIRLQAYASLGGQDASKAKWTQLGGRLVEQQPVLVAAAAHGRSAAQVLLRWALQKGVAVVPKANGEARMAENLTAGGFDLTEEESEAIGELEKGGEGRLCWKSDPLRMLEFP